MDFFNKILLETFTVVRILLLLGVYEIWLYVFGVCEFLCSDMLRDDIRSTISWNAT